ncbi:ER lumen protein retaining receptor family protein [Actinidia rufa]|uniref:ER lumen protein retaining receptor family protein n=1 Tax=Actinidia rufa TaxID=165716 RepID=A0A7J0GR90_9ERIC|nr:ER lumen protein retaining receptor family protein [Actinidia rufa]
MGRRRSSPVNKLFVWVRRQSMKVKTFLAVTAVLTALVVLKLLIRDHNHFFVASEVIHAAGIIVLIFKLSTQKTCSGLSLKTQELTAIFLAVRVYCSFVLEGDIHTVLDFATLLSTAWVVYMIRFKLKSTYTEELDNMTMYYLVNYGGYFQHAHRYFYDFLDVGIWKSLATVHTLSGPTIHLVERAIDSGASSQLPNFETISKSTHRAPVLKLHTSRSSRLRHLLVPRLRGHLLKLHTSKTIGLPQLLMSEPPSLDPHHPMDKLGDHVPSLIRGSWIAWPSNVHSASVSCQVEFVSLAYCLESHPQYPWPLSQAPIQPPDHQGTLYGALSPRILLQHSKKISMFTSAQGRLIEP